MKNKNYSPSLSELWLCLCSQHHFLFPSSNCSMNLFWYNYVWRLRAKDVLSILISICLKSIIRLHTHIMVNLLAAAAAVCSLIFRLNVQVKELQSFLLLLFSVYRGSDRIRGRIIESDRKWFYSSTVQSCYCRWAIIPFFHLQSALSKTSQSQLDYHHHNHHHSPTLTLPSSILNITIISSDIQKCRKSPF